MEQRAAMAAIHDKLPSKGVPDTFHIFDPQKGCRQILVQIGLGRKGESDIGSLVMTDI